MTHQRLTRSREDQDWLMHRIELHLGLVFLGRYLGYTISQWVRTRRRREIGSSRWTTDDK